MAERALLPGERVISHVAMEGAQLVLTSHRVWHEAVEGAGYHL